MTSDRPAGPPLAAPSSPKNLNPAAPVFRQTGQDKGQNSFPSDLVPSEKDISLAMHTTSLGGAGGEPSDNQTQSQIDSGGEDGDNVADSVSSVGGASDTPDMTREDPAYIEKVITPIKTQLEYYFSSENLPNDKYMNTHMDINKFVPLELISNFNRMKPICSSIDQMVQAVEMSSVLELNDDKTKVRISQTRKTLTLRGLPPKATDDDIRKVLEDNDCPKPMHIEMITLHKAPVSNWYVSFATESECLDAFFKLHNSKVMIDGYSIGCCIKSSGTLAATGSFPSPEETQQRRIAQQTQQSAPVVTVSGNMTQQPSAAVVAATAAQQPTALMQPFSPMALHPALMATTAQGLYYNQNPQYLNMPYMITQTWPGTAAMEPGLMLQGGGLPSQHIRTQLPRPHVMPNATQPRFARPQRPNNRQNMDKGSILDRSHERPQGSALSTPRNSPRGMDNSNNPTSNILSSIPRRSNIRDDVTVTIGGHPVSGQQQQLVSAVISQPHTVTVGPAASATIVNSVLDNSALSVPPNPVNVPVHNQLLQQQQQQQQQQHQQQVHHTHHPPQPLLPSLSGSNPQASSNQPLMTQHQQQQHHHQPPHHQSHPHHHHQPPPIHHQQGQLNPHHPHHHNQQQQPLSVSNSQSQHVQSQHQPPPPHQQPHHHQHQQHHHHHPHQQPPMHGPSHHPPHHQAPTGHHHHQQQQHHHHHPHYPPHHHGHQHHMMPAQHHQPPQQHHPHNHHQMLSSTSHPQQHHLQQAPNFGGRNDLGNRRNKKRRDDPNVRNVRAERQTANRSNFSSQVPPVPDNFTMEANSFPPLPGASSTPSSETSQENRMMHSDIVKGVGRVPSLSSNAPPPSATRCTSSSTPSPIPTPTANNPSHHLPVGTTPVQPIDQQHQQQQQQHQQQRVVATEEMDSMSPEDEEASLSQEEADIDIGVVEPVATISRQIRHDLQISTSGDQPTSAVSTVQNRYTKAHNSNVPVASSQPSSSSHKNSDSRQSVGSSQVIQPPARHQQHVSSSTVREEHHHNLQQQQFDQQQENNKERPSYAQILQNKRDAAAANEAVMNAAQSASPAPVSPAITNGPNNGNGVGTTAGPPQQQQQAHQNNYPARAGGNINNAFREQGNYMANNNQGSRPPPQHRLPKDTGAGGAARLDGPQSRMPNGRRNSKENRAQGGGGSGGNNNNKHDRRKPGDGRPK